MNQILTQKEINKIQNMCFNNPAKCCAIIQLIADTVQLVGCSTFAKLNNKSKRTVIYQAEKLAGLKIENRKFISLIQ